MLILRGVSINLYFRLRKRDSTFLLSRKITTGYDYYRRHEALGDPEYSPDLVHVQLGFLGQLISLFCALVSHSIEMNVSVVYS